MGEFDPDIPDRLKPLFFYEVGIKGCAPLNFSRRLAKHFGAQFISTHVIRRELSDGQLQREDEGGGHVLDSNIYNKFAPSATNYLLDGEDVVARKFFNTPKSRGKPQGIAHYAKALPVAMHIETDQNIILDRVERWIEKGAFIIPLKYQKFPHPPLAMVNDMKNNLVPPSSDEPSVVLHLDGALPTKNMIEQVEAQLIKLDLIDPA